MRLHDSSAGSLGPKQPWCVPGNGQQSYVDSQNSEITFQPSAIWQCGVTQQTVKEMEAQGAEQATQNRVQTLLPVNWFYPGVTVPLQNVCAAPPPCFQSLLLPLTLISALPILPKQGGVQWEGTLQVGSGHYPGHRAERSSFASLQEQHIIGQPAWLFQSRGP